MNFPELIICPLTTPTIYKNTIEVLTSWHSAKIQMNCYSRIDWPICDSSADLKDDAYKWDNT